MTDMPSFGVLCCGKDITELAEAVKCCDRITKIMKNGGFTLGGYHTAVAKKDGGEKEKMCGDKLYHLARLSDVLFTVGCDGFSCDDIIPDITMKLCESEVAFFTSNLCGLYNIGNYDKGKKEAFLPSRSRAGILKNCLVLNIRSDCRFIDAVLPSLLPSLSFAVSGLCGKNAKDSCRLISEFEKLYKSYGTPRSELFKRVQKVEINKI
jgi:molybdopterin biosynthesis enzyme MoaB